MAHAQAGEIVVPELGLVEPAMLPTFGELSGLGAAGLGLNDLDASAPFLIEPLSMMDKRKYAAIFYQTDASGDGCIEGDDARQLMVKSALPQEFLVSYYWMLVLLWPGALPVPI